MANKYDIRIKEYICIDGDKVTDRRKVFEQYRWHSYFGWRWEEIEPEKVIDYDFCSRQDYTPKWKVEEEKKQKEAETKSSVFPTFIGGHYIV